MSYCVSEICADESSRVTEPLTTAPHHVTVGTGGCHSCPHLRQDGAVQFMSNSCTHGNGGS